MLVRMAALFVAGGVVVTGAAGPAHAVPFFVPPPGTEGANASGGPAAPSSPPRADPASPYDPGQPPAHQPAPGGSSGPPPYAYPPGYYPPPPYYPYPPPPRRDRPPPWLTPAYAADREEWIRRKPGWHSHEGFYLNLGAGIAYVHNTMGNAAGNGRANGTGIALSAALGAAVTKNVILCVRASMSDSETHYVDGARGYEMDGASAENAMLGLGVISYLDESNMFFGGTLGVTSFDVRGDFGRYIDSRGRFGGALEVGKEWWVSPNWGLGGVVRASYGTVKDLSIANGVWRNLGVGLLLSATYN